MAEMETMFATESLVSCSPIRTRILEVDPPAVQWAAVRMCLSEIRDPPHQGWLPNEDTSPTCQGYSLTAVSCPPTILVPLFTWPQLQVEDPVVVAGAAVVVGAAVSAVVVGAAVPTVVVTGSGVDSSVVPVVPSMSPEPDTIHLKPPAFLLRPDLNFIWMNPSYSDIPKSNGKEKPCNSVP